MSQKNENLENKQSQSAKMISYHLTQQDKNFDKFIEETFNNSKTKKDENLDMLKQTPASENLSSAVEKSSLLSQLVDKKIKQIDDFIKSNNIPTKDIHTTIPNVPRIEDKPSHNID